MDISAYTEPVERPDVVVSWKYNALAFLRTYYPNATLPELESFVNTVANERYRPRKVTNIVQPSYGNFHLEEHDLRNFIKDISDKIITPIGAIYETANIKSAFSKQMVEDFLKRRKVVKKAMLDFKQKGLIELSKLKDYQQATIKINTNSLIGAMGSPYNCFYDLAGFNAITSLARGCIMRAYAHTERFLEGNFYFPNSEWVINHIVIATRKRSKAADIEAVMNKYNLHWPTAEEVLKFLISGMSTYTDKFNEVHIGRLLCNLPRHTLAYLYYADNMKQLCMVNTPFFKSWIDDLFDESKMMFDEDVDINGIFKLDGDLIALISPVYDKYLNGRLIYELPKPGADGQPDTFAAKKMMNIANHIQNKLTDMNDLFDVFMDARIDVPNISEHKNMIRKCVVASDTDSVLFTTKSWSEWYSGRPIDFGEKSTQVCSLIVYWLSKTTETVLQRMSIARGTCGRDINAIKMKNELYYPAYIRCPVKKHYVGRYTIQEGRKLKEPVVDIKGLQFKDSKLQKITLDYVESCLLELLKDIEENEGNISVCKYINKTVQLEDLVYRDLEEGNITFLGINSIKTDEEYDDPEGSIHFNYQAWQAIFAEKYGDINIPVKAPTLPLADITLAYMEWLFKHHPDIYEKFQKFRENTNSKKLTRIPMCPIIDRIPIELIPLVNKRKVVSNNVSPLHLLLKSFGVNIGNLKNTNLLYRDIYGSNYTENTSIE